MSVWLIIWLKKETIIAGGVNGASFRGRGRGRGRGGYGGSRDWRVSNVDKVLKSVRECAHALLTEKDLKALYGVGPKTAQELLAVLEKQTVSSSSLDAGSAAAVDDSVGGSRAGVSTYVPTSGRAPHAVLTLLACSFPDECTSEWVQEKAFLWLGQAQTNVQIALDSFINQKGIVQMVDPASGGLLLTSFGLDSADATRARDSRCYDLVKRRMVQEEASACAPSARASGQVLARSSSVRSTTADTLDFPTVEASFSGIAANARPYLPLPKPSARRRSSIPPDPSSWELVLLVDNRELPNRRNRAFLPLALRQKGVHVEVRALPLGDMMWVVRRPAADGCPGLESPPSRHDQEYVLDFIIERKTAEDLACSIKDGRFLEQKFRLDKSGLLNVIYLVECELNTQDVLPADKLLSAVVYTEAADEYMVQRTAGPADTVKFLAMMHGMIAARTVDDPLWSGPQCTSNRTFQFFHEKLSKSASSTVGDVFGAMLRQVSGMSASRAEMVLARYPTPAALLRAYDALPESDGAGRQSLLKMAAARARALALGMRLAKLWRRYTATRRTERDVVCLV